MNRTIQFTSTGSAVIDLCNLRDAIREGNRPDDRKLVAILDLCIKMITEKAHANAELHEQTARVLNNLVEQWRY